MKLFKFILPFMLVFTLYSKPIDQDKVRLYTALFSKLTVDQKMMFAMSFYSGYNYGLGIIQAAIVWKESAYGVSLVNDKDGLYGSYGLGQILLTTSMSRHKITSKKDRDNLRMRLITDHKFNLREGLTELRHWKEIHLKKNKKDWLKYTIASYNNGHKSYDNEKGKRYADDVLIRMEAIKLYFSKFEKESSSILIDAYFKDIKYLLRKYNKI